MLCCKGHETAMSSSACQVKGRSETSCTAQVRSAAHPWGARSILRMNVGFGASPVLVLTLTLTLTLAGAAAGGRLGAGGGRAAAGRD